jgi:hypothetical protein
MPGLVEEDFSRNGWTVAKCWIPVYIHHQAATRPSTSLKAPISWESVFHDRGLLGSDLIGISVKWWVTGNPMSPTPSATHSDTGGVVQPTIHNPSHKVWNGVTEPGRAIYLVGILKRSNIYVCMYVCSTKTISEC